MNTLRLVRCDLDPATTRMEDSCCTQQLARALTTSHNQPSEYMNRTHA